MAAYSAELSSCAACGIATCNTTNGLRTMQMHPFKREHYSPIVFTLAAPCPWKTESTKSIGAKTAGDENEREKVDKFILFLYKTGFPRLAEHFLKQLLKGIQPEDIILPIEEAYSFPTFESNQQPASSKKGETTKDISHEIGKKSEDRLFQLLKNRELFPWIKEVIIAPLNNPGFDCTLLIDEATVIGRILKTPKVYVDAKSSIGNVEAYYRSKTRRQSDGARQALVRDKKYWAVNAYEDNTDQEIYAQIVTYLLITANKFNQPKHWKQILNNIHETVRIAFEVENNIVFVYGRIVMQALLSSDTEKQLKQSEEEFEPIIGFEVVRARELVAIRQ